MTSQPEYSACPGEVPSNIPVVPATPPGRGAISYGNAWRSPISDSDSLDGPFYSPCSNPSPYLYNSDRPIYQPRTPISDGGFSSPFLLNHSSDSLAPHSYNIEQRTYHGRIQSSPVEDSYDKLAISTTEHGGTPQDESLWKEQEDYGRRQYKEASFHDDNELSPVMPQLPMLGSGVLNSHPNFPEGSSVSSAIDAQDHLAPTLLLSPPAHSSPADSWAFTGGSTDSRTSSETRVPTGVNFLTVPPRRHSFNDRRPDGGVFFDSTPDTWSQSSQSSFLSSSPSASQGSSPNAVPVSRRVVASDANINASYLRRKKPGKFKCGQCAATFTARHNLKNHENAHAGIRPYACPFCEGTFTTASTAVRHSKKCRASFYPFVDPSSGSSLLLS